MATIKTDYAPHKQYVTACFGWPHADYKTKVFKDLPGLRVNHPRQGSFQVETLAERVAVCQECLLNVLPALEVTGDLAALALENTPPEPELVERILDLLEENGVTQERRIPRKMVLVYTALAGDSIRDFWRGVGMLNPWFLAAGLVLLEQAGQPGVLARQLADLYFKYPGYLSAVPQGRVGRASLGELEMALYQVGWGSEGEPVPEPEPESVPEPEKMETVPEAGSGGKRRAARRRVK